MNEEILKTIKERGLLLEKEIFDLLNNIGDVDVVRGLLENLERFSGQKIITRGVLNKNIEFVRSVVNKSGNKSEIENVFVKLGLSLEIRKESIVESEGKTGILEKKNNGEYKVFYANTAPDKKLELGDFVGHFRARYHQIQRILMQRPDLKNLVSIGKISGGRQNLSIIGIVTEKRVTKNKNLIIKFEDLTGEVNALVKVDRAEIFDKADELQLDDIVGVKASGDREILFVHDILFPDAFMHEKVRFNEDICAAFLSDVHCGSDKHLGANFEKFLEWINSDDELAGKIRYLFFVGDNVDGVGIYPGQEARLKLGSMKEQYELLASYLSRIPKNITMFMCPGQHDAGRVAEPQPIISKRYAPALYNVENLVLVTNPTMVKLLEAGKEFKVLMYHGDSIHSFIHEIKELRVMKAQKCPAKAVKHMLKRRHLAPVHGEAVYIPNANKDPMVIEEVPDVLCTGEVHRLDVETYNGVLIITGSCWQSQTSFEEKVGNIPDPCKVPVLNLKTRELRILDFSDAILDEGVGLSKNEDK